MTEIISRIVVYVTSNRTASATVESAVKIADHFGASLMGIHVKADVNVAMMAPGDGMLDAGLIEEMEKQAEHRAEEAKRTFESVTGEHARESEWCCIESRGMTPRDTVAGAVHLSDLIVLGQSDPEEDAGVGEILAQDLVLDAGRPVLLCPHGWSRDIGKTHILIAWKNGREATRALHDSLPFLSKTKAVTVTVAMPGKGPGEGEEEPGAALCRYLAQHGIVADARPLYGVGDGDAGQALISYAETVGADLIVLGAYSHSRLREGIFGGVTRDVIEKTTVPALLSH